MARPIAAGGTGAGHLIFGPVATIDAAGTVLAHALLVDGDRWPKGRLLSDADIAAASEAGIATIVVARIGTDDVAEDAAAAKLAATLAGPGVIATAAAHGRTNLIATANGLLLLDRAAIDRVNAVDESITVGTLAPMTRVAAGDVIATVKLIPFAVPVSALDATVATATPIVVAGFRPRRFRLLQTRLPATSEKMLARTDAVTRARIIALDSALDSGWDECDHEADALAGWLTAQPANAILLIAGASATADRRDVIPTAIVAAGGAVERLGMPVDPGNLLCLGVLGGRAVIGLPGCARSPKRNGFDWVLERLAAGIAVTSGDIAAMGVGGLLPEAERPQPRAARAQTVTVGVIVLAAGRSTRMGAANKLIADLDGKPVVAHVVDAIAAAGLPPPIVVVGHMAAAVRAALGDRPATYVTAPDFAEGMSRSLRTGLAAAPLDWRAAIIALGDMPSVDAETYAALAAAAIDRVPVVIPTWHGKRGNPLAWSRAHWTELSGVTGDGGGKVLLAALSDRLVELPVDDPGILADVDTPEALAALRLGVSPG
ncbi:NTP transferase domain-containing protein [Polymorphobacter sp. PAMC 29334]|uniref:NTP transferase domain-containing protein n=1 Tax=Polymorphobacter sp. PAMC 29334 TaxID=2862331 RepID=UPI001D023F87|nr:molybdopterin-binding/glycosyltransferase family 2 protein [Polymorphobacter sp. PAMC 29334]